jgi:diguanylate cyclase (GGDEF)-like protein/PAS domain S-box-containing protein
MRGERRFLSGWASPIYGLKGEIVGAIESIRDVTEQRAMEMSLAAEYQQLSSIMDGSPVSTFVINRDRCVILWNLVCELITGIPKEEVLGKPINLRSLYSNEKAPPTLAELVLEMKDEEILEKHSKRGVCKSTIHPEAFEAVDAIRIKGEEHIMVIQATRLRNAKGDIVGAIQCAQDMTERKRSEEELQHAKQKLEMWVGELEQRNREVNLLRQMGDLLHACDQFEEAYAVIGQFCPQLFPHAAGAVYTFGESRKAVESVVTWGDSLSSEQVFSPEDCWALRRGQLHVVTPPALGLRCRHVDPSASCDYLGVPMIAAGEITGLLHLEFHENRKCDQRAQEFALIVAEHLSLSLSNLKLRETLRAQSIRDPLTGLFNRRYMEESLEREIPRAVRAHRPVSLVMLDIDHFKHLNDTFGHDAGDSVLKELGALIQKHVREGDIACRFGGEEFILILPDAKIEVALQRAEHIRAVIKSLPLEHNRQQLGTVTVSLGIATYPDHGKESKVLLRMADEALYQAKKNGRDRVEIAERPEATS